jgi:hypothetical protein
MSGLDVNRREFLKITAGAGAALTMPTLRQTAVASSSKMIGIQVGAISFVDEGTEKVLDVLQERAGVNTLFLAVFTYGRGIAGRQIPGQPLPDHGKQEYDLNYHGGNFATPHPQYYKNTVIQAAHAPDHGDLDILAEVLPAAKKRGMKVICWMEDVFRHDLPNIEKVQERDLYGRNRETLCVNNPNYLNFFTGLVEDFASSYDIDGIMWGCERQGALSDSLGATHDTPPIDPGNVTCFCEFCQRKAKDRGINVERARQGFLELEKFVRMSRSGKRPVDGYYVQFWRLLLRAPGVILSRKYSEMRLANLSGAGEAIRELNLPPVERGVRVMLSAAIQMAFAKWMPQQRHLPWHRSRVCGQRFTGLEGLVRSRTQGLDPAGSSRPESIGNQRTGHRGLVVANHR